MSVSTSPAHRVKQAFRWLGISVFIFWSVLPIYLLVASSFKSPVDIFRTPMQWLFTPTLENYIRLWRDWPVFFDGLFNSIIISVGATVVTIAASTLSGWALSRYRSVFLTSGAFALVVLRLLPPIVITLPLFPAANFLGLADKHVLLMMLYATFFVSLGTWVMKATFDQVPPELEEAAASDGASFWRSFWHIALPLGVPGMVAAGVFVFIFSWNEYLFAFIFTTSRAKTAPVVLSEIMGSATGLDWGVMFAAATIQLVPVIIFIIFAQRFLIEGLSAGSTKG